MAFAREIIESHDTASVVDNEIKRNPKLADFWEGLEGMNNKIRLLSHRSFGLHSAEALISLVYLNCGGLTLERIH